MPRLIPTRASVSARLLLAALAGLPEAAPAHEAGIAELVAAVKPSIVAVATELKTRRPPLAILGTGFATGDGSRVVTNAHVIPDAIDDERNERLVVLVGSGRRPEIRSARVVASDPRHDVALLAIDGSPVPPLRVTPDAEVREGDEVLFTGFPIGNVLGLYPVTHRGMISAIAPHAIPLVSSKQLSRSRILALRDPYLVYQLDATAYPGNSGSPLIDIESGSVIGIINAVVVKDNKESVLTDPSAITYAIPAVHIEALLNR